MDIREGRPRPGRATTSPDGEELMSSTADGTAWMRAGWTGMAVAVTLGLTGCSGPAEESPAVAADDAAALREEVAGLRDEVTRLEDQVTGLEDLVAALEDRVSGPDGPTVDGAPDEPQGAADPLGAGQIFFDDPESRLGQRVTVRGEIAQVLAATEVASAFRLAGQVGEPVAVVSATPPPEIARGDVVEVSGTAVEVDPATFEADFGVAPDALFDRPGSWLAGATGQVALAAVSLEVIRSVGGD